MRTVIRVENLSKRYTLHHERQERYTALRDVITDKVRGAGRALLSPFAKAGLASAGASDEDFWALRDVSFDIRQGERIGIIGRNGAGKSTLLKILSRITEPSGGKVKIKGRVASLLEVGTGFHPELTGRENIYLNGAILGMRRTEIARKFDEIVAFAEVERFLDTPVKRYSSGMYVRLAFAVAAHLEPEILIIDEVLAVGDAQFQKKCLGKMEDVSRQDGRTVIFVSHNMTAVQHLCSSCVFLSGGRVKSVGSTSEVIDGYLSSDSLLAGSLSFLDRKDRKGSGEILFDSVCFKNGLGVEVDSFRSGDSARFTVEVTSGHAVLQKNIVVALGIDNNMGERITVLSSEICGQSIEIPPGRSSITIFLPQLLLTSGRYYFTLFLSANGVITDWIQNAGYFPVEESDYYGTGKIGQDQGSILMNYTFS
jgi:lipopolysaccharide transport system ATP-binding protein